LLNLYGASVKTVVTFPGYMYIALWITSSQTSFTNSQGNGLSYLCEWSAIRRVDIFY